MRPESEMKKYVGQPMQVDDLLRLARYHRRLNLAAKLEHLDISQYDLFLSDGCSMWPDNWGGGIDLTDACFWHDVAYFIGGTAKEKVEADNQLRRDVLLIAGAVMATAMFAGVSVGGWIPGTGFEWGYGKLNR